jgi:hypothetical protein
MSQDTSASEVRGSILDTERTFCEDDLQRRDAVQSSRALRDPLSSYGRPQLESDEQALNTPRRTSPRSILSYIHPAYQAQTSRDLSASATRGNRPQPEVRWFQSVFLSLSLVLPKQRINLNLTLSFEIEIY